MMKLNNTFSKDDLRGFILLFCASADFKVSQLEFEYIESKIGASSCNNLYKEMCESNDYQIINKILHYKKALNFSNEDKNTLFGEVCEMFRTDSSKYNLKHNFFRGLKRILN